MPFIRVIFCMQIIVKRFANRSLSKLCLLLPNILWSQDPYFLKSVWRKDSTSLNNERINRLKVENLDIRGKLATTTTKLSQAEFLQDETWVAPNYPIHTFSHVWFIQVDPDADELFATLIVFTDAGGANTEHKFVLTLHLLGLCLCLCCK